jgi:hypothetical protein
MAPHGNTLPQALTESARAARMSFYCEMCGKGYARMNEFQAHESSYDHSHRMVRLFTTREPSLDNPTA